MLARLACVAAALFLAAGPSLAQRPDPAPEKKAPIDIGSAAPALQVEKWLKGSPVASFEKGKSYVVEFWATWSGPCVASMPHLTALSRQYKDITFIGVTTKGPRNDLPAVEAMVKQKGDGMDYAVAWDEGSRTRDAYMEAAAQKAIPCAFVVDGAGKIAFIGHPMFLDLPLERLAAGTWDARKGSDAIDAAEKALDRIFEVMPGDPKDALATIGAFEKEFPDYLELVALTKFEVLLAAGDEAAAYACASKLVDEAIEHKETDTLNDVAWRIVDPKAKWAKVDLDLAQRAAEKGVAFTGEKDEAVLDTLARVWFLKGNVAKAIEIETKAAAVATGKRKEDVEKTLAEYKAKANRG